jgi:hypothetical protein
MGKFITMIKWLYEGIPAISRWKIFEKPFINKNKTHLIRLILVN